MKLTYIIFSLLALILAASPARAAYIDLGVAGEYNTFLFNDYSMQYSDIQGRLAVDGDVTLEGYSVGGSLPSGSSGSALVASGDLNFTNGTVYGDVTVGGTANVASTVDVKGTISGNALMPFSFSVQEAYLTGLSSNLSGLASNGQVVNNWGSLALTGDNSSMFQVFNVDGLELINAHGLSIDQIAEGATVLINVSGDITGLTNMQLFNFDQYSENLLFNFYEASAVTIANLSVEGSILAPTADVDAMKGHINGTLIASSLEGHYQQNFNLFRSTSPVPEPGTFLITGLGLLGLAGFLRRGNRRTNA